MPTTILAMTAASLSELKNNPMAIVASGDGFPVAILVGKREQNAVHKAAAKRL